MSALRYYKIAECDEHGVPLDWKKCRTCEGTGHRISRVDPTWQDTSTACEDCDGHGSLRAAALAFFPRICPHDKPLIGINRDHHEKYDPCALVSEAVHRCEDCGHSMSEGTWAGAIPSFAESGALYDHTDYLSGALAVLQAGHDPFFGKEGVTHYSACDDGCRHGGPVRQSGEGVTEATFPLLTETVQSVLEPGKLIEASWRTVDIHTLDRPCMLEPEYLAILCLRCFAERKRSA